MPGRQDVLLRGASSSLVLPARVAAGAAVGSPTVSTTSSSTMPGGDVAHGSELTMNHVGPWTLQGVAKGSEVLAATTLTQMNERYSTWPGTPRPSYIPGTPYVYNNDPNNHGGIVPAGGMVIDGFNVPAGVWVVQFRDMSVRSVIVEGWVSGAGGPFAGVFFRGIRARGNYGAPGWFSQNGQQVGAPVWFTYMDAGGTSTSVMCESIIESKASGDPDQIFVRRCYLSLATTLCFGRNNCDAFVENFCEKVTDFGDATKHLNGIGNAGGETGTLWLRNNMVLQKLGSPNITQLTDVIQMAADDGDYQGTGVNWNGVQGYVIQDNYLGGANFTLQLGQDKANTAEGSVRNVIVTGNLFTTSLYPNSGESGVGYKGPTWGSFGNTWTNNRWADGPNAGQLIPSSAVVHGP